MLTVDLRCCDKFSFTPKFRFPAKVNHHDEASKDEQRAVGIKLRKHDYPRD